MNKSSLYTWLSAISSFIGTGMLLGHSLGDSTKNTALWIGGILVILGAITLGMSIASRSSVVSGANEEPRKDSNEPQ